MAEDGVVSWETSPEAAAEGTSTRGRGQMHVFFYEAQVKNNAKSLAAERPIFEPRIKIKKLVPGDSRLVIDNYARPEDFEQFPVEYARFKQKKSNMPVGTPIDAWPVLTDSQKAEFRAMNIFTVEQFANLPDEAGNRVMGLQELRKKARGFVLAQEAGEKLVAMEEKAKADEAEKANQAKVIAELTARLAALEGGKRETLTVKR
jgi:hypothetical protein